MTSLFERRFLHLVLAASLFLFLVPGSASAQVSGTGVITGEVTDQTGAVMPGVQVTITQAASKASQTTTTNQSGRYTFSFVQPGVYDVSFSKTGFAKARVRGQELIVGGQVNVNVTLRVGPITQTVEVTVTPGAQLQTLNATMSTTLSGSAIMNLPTLSRDVAALLNYEPTAAPAFGGSTGNYGGASSNIFSGQVAGAQSDQNTYMLDGGNNTDDLAGDSGYINNDSNGNNFSGAPRGNIPVPAESVEEFRINTNNMTADFGASGGAQVLLTTKRGTDQFHGSGYDFFQSGKLDSNSWDNNFFGTPKPNSHQNRFGFDVGGPMLPNMLGGKTYFYFFYEGNRYPRAGPYSAMVPTNSLKNGILTLPDAAGNPVQYNLTTSMQCGPTGTSACDPGDSGVTGINPTIQKLWNTYEPPGNSNILGDGMNTTGFRANLTFPLSDNYIAGRIDHDFGSKWRWFSVYRYFKESNLSDLQTDIGGLLPGDKLGVPAAAANNPNQPRFFVTGLSASLTPKVTNDFHFQYSRNNWEWKRAGVLPQISGIPAALEPGGESAYALIPIDIRAQDARRRLWDGHDWNYRDTLTWIKGSHFFQFGGEAMHQWLHFNRYDQVFGGTVQPLYNIGDGSYLNPDGSWFSAATMNIGPNYQPMPCTASVTTNCLPASELNTWDGYYAMLLGMVYSGSTVRTRTGSSLSLNPDGTPLATYDRQDVYNVYFSDAWHLRPNWTLNYGLNWGVQLAPVDQHGQQMILVDTSGHPVTEESYFANFEKAMNAGQEYNPTLGFNPIGKVAGGMKYPYSNYWNQWAPRVSLAYSPRWSGGWLGKLFGGGTTVIRGGYARVYDRQNAINGISSTTLGEGFLQSVSCTYATTTGACINTTPSNPANAFRIGINGNSLDLSAPQTLPTPVLPNINAAYPTNASSQDTQYQPGVSDEIDFSIQKQLKGNTIVEVGYVGRWMKHIFLGIDLNQVPVNIKEGGQSFANAYDNLYMQLSKGQTVTNQPFFETALAGSSYCAGFSSCTAAVAANEGGNITTQAVTTLWSDLDSSWNPAVFAGPTLLADTQMFSSYQATSEGFANYQALVMSVEKRSAEGLTLDANFTYGHALGTNGLSQTYTLGNVNNPFNLRTDYGPQFFDRKFVFNLLGNYVLPFGEGQHFSSSSGIVNRLIGGWSVSPVYEWGSGLPLPFDDGSYQEWGNGFFGDGASMVPLVNTRNLSNVVHYNVAPGATVGANGSAGLNIFPNPTQVFNSFRPPLVGLDNRSMIAGQLRGQTQWSFDLGLNKNTKITERVNAQIFVQAFNLFNHTQFNAPYLAFNDPADFGVPNDGGGNYQLNTINGNYTRVIQLGLRFFF
jgi:Carboxypeptidase regulatory-like domain